jgi:hypothetical protein
VTITGTSGGVSYSTQVEVKVAGACVPARCVPGECGTRPDYCGGTLYCGACPPPSCPAGEHSCGTYCTKVVCN